VRITSTRSEQPPISRAFRGVNDHQRARGLDEHTLARLRRTLGEDHAHALGLASNLANYLRSSGELQDARDLDEDILARRRRLFGDDHHSTLISAGNLAANLHALGNHERARVLFQDTLTRRRNHDPDHPDTLQVASNFARLWRTLGDYQQARTLHEDTLSRRRRVLGEDHPATRDSARSHAADLEGLRAQAPEQQIFGQTNTDRSTAKDPSPRA
jgi:hypothetical protein